MRLENTTGTSSKFWEVEVDGAEYTVRYGKIGTENPRVHKKTFATAAEAKLAADKAVRQKTRDGYSQADTFEISTTQADLPVVGAKTVAGASALSTRMANLAPTVSLSGFRRAADHLRELDRCIDNFVVALENYQPPQVAGPSIASLHKLDPRTVVAAQTTQRNWQALKTRTPEMLVDRPAGTASVVDVQALADFVHGLVDWQDTLRMPVNFELSGPESSLKNAITNATKTLPRTIKPTPAKLNAAGFAALADDGKRDAWARQDEIGYELVEADIPTNAENNIDTEHVLKILDDKGVERLFGAIANQASRIQDTYDDSFSGMPSVSSVQELRNGDDVIGYRLEAAIFSDSGNTGVHFYMHTDVNGHVFDGPGEY